uniref:RAB6-interacting golgin n=1 Tax=Tabanus bromius TaxID=304241 RepID=A0A0K8TSW2_TABBR
MSGKFNGFTQDDINKIANRTNKAKNFLNGPGIRRVPDKKPPSTKTESNDATKKSAPAKDCALDKPMTEESMTSLQEAVHFRPLPAVRRQSKSKEEHSDPENTDESILHISRSENESNAKNLEKKPVMVNSPFKGISLKDFESQRKLIEEQNKQKKAMLYKAIEQYSEKTAMEVKKIQEIKSELSKLDSDLAADVAILRKQIELASLQYSHVQKQYQQIESQFLKAKLDLHNAFEKKEMLTEHLCAIIAHNEDRKAKKLTELMEKVGISPTGEYVIPED